MPSAEPSGLRIHEAGPYCLFAGFGLWLYISNHGGRCDGALSLQFSSHIVVFACLGDKQWGCIAQRFGSLLPYSPCIIGALCSKILLFRPCSFRWSPRSEGLASILSLGSCCFYLNASPPIVSTPSVLGPGWLVFVWCMCLQSQICFPLLTPKASCPFFPDCVSRILCLCSRPLSRPKDSWYGGLPVAVFILLHSFFFSLLLY